MIPKAPPALIKPAEALGAEATTKLPAPRHMKVKVRKKKSAMKPMFLRREAILRRRKKRLID